MEVAGEERVTLENAVSKWCVFCGSFLPTKDKLGSLVSSRASTACNSQQENRCGRSWKILKPRFEMFNPGLQAALGTCDYTRQPELRGLSSVPLRVPGDIFHREMCDYKQANE